MSTNMQVLQTSVFIKYRSLYEFLQSQAQDVAREIQRAYVAATRVYYETGFRRYLRILGWVKVSLLNQFERSHISNLHKARSAEKSETIATSDPNANNLVEESRLVYAKIEGPAAVQAYVAEDKNYVSIFRCVRERMSC